MTKPDSGAWRLVDEERRELRRYERDGYANLSRPYEKLSVLYIRALENDDHVDEIVTFQYEPSRQKQVPDDASPDDPHDFAAIDRIVRSYASDAGAKMLLLCDPFGNPRALLEQLGYVFKKTDKHGDAWYTATCVTSESQI